MKRRHFLASVALGSLGTTLAQVDPTTPKPPLVRTPLVLMSPRADGIEAVWSVTRLSRGRLEWESGPKTNGQAGTDAFGFVPQSSGVLRVRVSGLQPGTTYRVRSHTIAADTGETVVSEWKTFKTLNPRAETTRFVMWNDTHMQTETIRALNAASPPADFLVWNGDTCNDWSKEEAIIPALLHPGECDITAGRPLFVTWGNHDCRGLYAFRMPEVIATPTGRPFYAFRSGPLAVICLHTGEDKPDHHPSFRGRVSFDALRAEQARWLATIIEQPEFRDAPYRLVFCHIPLRWRDESPQDYDKSGFDRHSGRSRAAWNKQLVGWKAQVILSGHTHQPIWMAPVESLPYGQITGGGPKLEAATWTEGVADGKQLKIAVRNLAGTVMHEATFRPVA